MWSILALGAVEKLIHHIIDLDAITRIQLNQLHSKMLRVVLDSPQLSVDVFFDDKKVRLEPTATGHTERSSIFEQRPFDHKTSGCPKCQKIQLSDFIDRSNKIHHKKYD